MIRDIFSIITKVQVWILTFFYLIPKCIPFIQYGAEFLKTKQGDHNSYKSNDDINSIKWYDKEKFIDVFNYNKGLIEIRRSLPHFRLRDTELIKNNINFIFAGNSENCGVLIQHINLNNYD